MLWHTYGWGNLQAKTPVIVTSMQNEEQTKAALLEVLREEISKLLVADDVSEEEKLARFERATAILNGGDD